MIYDEFASRLARDYELFLFAISGRYLSYVLPRADASPQMVTQFEQGAASLRETFLNNANQAIDEYARSQPSARLGELAFGFRSELTRITADNMQVLSGRLRGTVFGESMLMRGFAGPMGLLLQQKLSQPEFTVTTASGRTYQALPLVKSQAREFAYRSWLSAELARIAPYTDLVSVTYPDSAHEGNGRVFSISGRTPGFPSFADIEESVFHYNATAGVTHHVSA